MTTVEPGFRPIRDIAAEAEANDHDPATEEMLAHREANRAEPDDPRPGDVAKFVRSMSKVWTRDQLWLQVEVLARYMKPSPTVLELHEWFSRAAEEVWPQGTATEQGDDYPYFIEELIVPPVKPPYNGLWSADSHSIMFGPGGTGKGVLAVETVCRMLHEGRRVVILDYEGHPEEWKPRVESLYRATYEVDIPARSLVYLPPRDRKLGLPHGGLHKQAVAILTLMQRLGSFDNIVIDSALRAVGIDDPNSTMAVTQYGDAIDILGLPSLTFSHTTKQNDDPRYPYGSVWWHDWARMTWGVVKVEGPNGSHGLVLKNRKNSSGAPLGTRRMTVHWSIGGGLIGVTVDEVEEALLDRLVEWLESRTSAEPTTGWADTARGLLVYEAGGGEVLEEAVRLESNNLRRLVGRIPPGDNRVEVCGTGQLRASKGPATP